MVVPRALLLSASILLSAAVPGLAAEQTPDPPQHHHGVSSLFESRDASGTAWLPDETPTYDVGGAWRGWNLMAHGIVFGQFLYEAGEIHRTGGFSEHGYVRSLGLG